jgi:Do/DeqQ family serine protease
MRMRKPNTSPGGFLAIGGLLAAAAACPAAAQQTTISDAQRGSRATSILEGASFAPIIEKFLPAVVSIRVKGFEVVEQNPLYKHPLFTQMVQDKLAEPEQRAFQSSGSGVVIDPARGLILTNFHVIEKAKEVKVHFQDGREFDGKVLGQDGATDVAVVQIAAQDTAPIPIGDSLKARVGDLVIAIGNPFALEATATLGMISSLRRTTVGFREFESYIQHDAAVNSGNSGGALINSRGELIGINTAIVSPSGGNVGLGFAIPIGIAQNVMDQLVKYGRVRRGWNGIKVEDITPARVKEHGLTVLKGAFIAHVAKGSPAEKVGAKIGDVITAVSLPDGRQMSIENAAQLRAGEAITEVGMTVSLTLVRDRAPQVVTVVIEDFKREVERLEIPSTVFRLAGLVVGSLESDSPLFGEVKGVQVLEVKQGTFAQLVGLLPGDIITKVEQERVRRPDDFLKLVKDKNEKFEMHVERNGVPVLVKFPL